LQRRTVFSGDHGWLDINVGHGRTLAVGGPPHASAQAKERKDGHDHHNQSDEVDQTVHVFSPSAAPRNTNVT
jgi:hypothetical protein